MMIASVKKAKASIEAKNDPKKRYRKAGARLSNFLAFLHSRTAVEIHIIEANSVMAELTRKILLLLFGRTQRRSDETGFMTAKINVTQNEEVVVKSNTDTVYAACKMLAEYTANELGIATLTSAIAKDTQALCSRPVTHAWCSENVNKIHAAIVMTKVMTKVVA